MSEAVVLSARGVQLLAASGSIDLDVAPGEIVGLAGLEGQGQEEFLETLAGLHTPAAGQVVAQADAGSVVINNLHTAVRARVAYLPRDRKSQGIFPPLSVLDNFAMSTAGAGMRFGLFSPRRQRERLARYRDQLSMVYASPEALITSLSGGNQQKVLLARCMALNPRVLLLNDPTRGVDLRTRMNLYDVFRQLARDDRMALVVLSTEIEELLQLCDRVLVFREYQVFNTFDREAMTMARIIASMFGNADGDETYS